MAWWPGKNIGRPQGGWIKSGLDRNNQLKQRGMDVPQPQYNADAMGQFKGAAQGGANAYGADRGAQGQALGLYRDAATGGAPSAAEVQMQAGSDQAIANQISLGAAGRTGNIGAQMQGAQQAGAGISAATNQQAAQLRAQEMEQARAGLAGLSTNMAGQSLQREATGLGLQAQASGQQLASETQWGLGQRQLDIEQLQGNRAFGMGIVDKAADAAAMGVMYSDKRAKANLAPSGGAATEAALKSKPSMFEYEPGMGPPGPRVGVTAQGLASTPAGRATVSQGPDGLLRVDPKQLASLSMAAAAENAAEIEKLKAKIGGKKKKKKVKAA